jgi:hypothetical protein
MGTEDDGLPVAVFASMGDAENAQCNLVRRSRMM